MNIATDNRLFDGLYIGLMSGTSCDGIDAALVDITEEQTKLKASYFLPFSADLRQQIINIAGEKNDSLNEVCILDYLLGIEFSKATQKLLEKAAIPAKDIIAIGSPGQTIRHKPEISTPYSVQIGDANLISHLSRITTVTDFRRKDIAAGGQGAPLVPAFHQHLFGNGQEQVIVNIGGMANISHLASNPCSIQGFDTGPGNILIDTWCNHFFGVNYDASGAIARSGKIITPLLSLFLEDDYFFQPPPKSTGREKFNLSWIQRHLASLKSTSKHEDVLCTLTELTVISISDAIQKYAPGSRRVIVCGGGTKNNYLMERLKLKLPISTFSSDEIGIDSDWIEAMAFAWLARQTLRHIPANSPGVTGAKEAVILGAIYPA